jgi:hypothetical protein
MESAVPNSLIGDLAVAGLQRLLCQSDDGQDVFLGIAARVRQESSFVKRDLKNSPSICHRQDSNASPYLPKNAVRPSMIASCVFFSAAM